ncbi:hypothetical protein WJX77_011290 [Trebouxia sp. C0004]
MGLPIPIIGPLFNPFFAALAYALGAARFWQLYMTNDPVAMRLSVAEVDFDMVLHLRCILVQIETILFSIFGETVS